MNDLRQLFTPEQLAAMQRMELELLRREQSADELELLEQISPRNADRQIAVVTICPPVTLVACQASGILIGADRLAVLATLGWCITRIKGRARDSYGNTRNQR